MSSLFSKALPISKRILLYWFDEIPCTSFRQMWYSKSPVVDRFITQEYKNVLESSQLSVDTGNVYDTLAKVILYDQFPRNIYRNDTRSYKYDSLALINSNKILNTEALMTQATNNFGKYEWSFVYTPFMHSEKLSDQKRSLEFFGTGHSFAKHHYSIIERFKRFPHRNKILGRKSTDDEIEFLKDPGNSF